MRVFLLSLLVAVPWVCPTPAPAQGWQTETILPFGTFYSPSIAIGPDHIAHLAVTSKNGVLMYLSRINGAWQYEIISNDHSVAYGSRGLRLRADGRARILTLGELFSQTGSGWTRSNNLISWAETSIAMAVDGDGVSRFANTWYISYIGDGAGVSYDAHQITAMDAPPMGSACAMEFTSDGTPNIVAVPSSTRPLVFYNDPERDGTWNAEVIGPQRLTPAMAIDASDRVHICYTTWGTSELFYSVRVGANEWVSERVDASGRGSFPSMAVASNGRVCISYYASDYYGTGGADLKFASKGRDETRWHITKVDANAASGSSIAVDGSAVHIAYTDAYGMLHHATAPLATGTGSLPALNSARIRAVPNPFNPSTTIEYAVPARGRVRVTVYDAAGRVMEKLVDTVRDAGSYRVQYSARGASGVYFARVEVAGQSATAKIVLLK